MPVYLKCFIYIYIYISESRSLRALSRSPKDALNLCQTKLKTFRFDLAKYFVVQLEHSDVVDFAFPFAAINQMGCVCVCVRRLVVVFYRLAKCVQIAEYDGAHKCRVSVGLISVYISAMIH